MAYHPNPAVDRLLVRKAEVDQRITDELKRPMPDTLILQGLKRLRLSLKDRATRLMRSQPYLIKPVAARVS